jgi:PAS domain S-box-containing protein
VTTAANGVITGVNSAACLMFGYESGEMVGGHFAVLLDESLRADALAMLEARGALSGDFKDDEREILCERKDGTVFQAELLLSGVIVDGQRIYTGIVHDISGRKTLERALRRSEALFRATFDQALVGIVHSNLDGRFIRANRTACEMLGYSEHEMLALGFRDVTHPEDLAVSEQRLGELLADPALPFHVTKRYLRKDGSAMWSLTSVSVVRRDDDLPDFLLSMVQDITELKHVEQMKNEFVSTVSHELRSPLTSIRGSLGLLAGGVAGALSPPARELVLIAEHSSERLILLVNDILDTERLESGKMRFELKPTELRGLVERAVESMEGYARERRVLLRVAAPEAPIRADVDGDRLIQVMTNLISNAVKFSPAEATVEVELARAADGGSRIEVRDRGPGIPKEFQARIFQRFSQADSSSSRQKGGTGLGLSIAKAIVEHLGGTIGYRTSPGEGSTFFVQLPAASEAAPAMAMAVAKEA